MLIHGSPIAVTLAADPRIQDRFWYWTGASGRKYIHSVYSLEHCPPLPGGVYVAVKRQGALRIAVGLGRFQPFWEGVLGASDVRRFAALGVDELHVHLLSKSAEQAEAVLSDLADAFDDGPARASGFAETAAGISSAPEALHAAAA